MRQIYNQWIMLVKGASMNSLVPTVTLNNGVAMPQLGLGVWQVSDGEEVESSVLAALRAGYRLIDTAAVYGNEVGVGEAIRKSGIPREEIFVTTKLWNGDQGKETARAAFERSLQKLGLEYIDLYLIHWPMPAKNLYVETWKELEAIYHEGKARAIGVSNFHQEHLDALLAEAEVTPAVNQIELHPALPQLELRGYCADHGIHIESWSPIGGSRGNLIANPVLQTIGDKYKKSPAQIMIRWHIQNGLIVIPKSVHEDRIKQNIDVFDFELSDEDMHHIANLETGTRQGPNPATMNHS
jgi:diketogulonate reductase-like aldo/keto reductase